MVLDERDLDRLCRCLLTYDPDIEEIVRFGSSVYAPEYAQDLDLLVFTRRRRPDMGYQDSLDSVDLPWEVDIIVEEVPQRLEDRFAGQVLGAYEVLYGDGTCLRKGGMKMEAFDYEDARANLRNARRIFGLCLETEDDVDRDYLVREAFDALFHAARVATMLYLSTDETRWGRVKRALPPPYRERFDRIIETLHVGYFYRGSYPKDRLQTEFENWSVRVEKYVDDLENERSQDNDDASEDQ